MQPTTLPVITLQTSNFSTQPIQIDLSPGTLLLICKHNKCTNMRTLPIFTQETNSNALTFLQLQLYILDIALPPRLSPLSPSHSQDTHNHNFSILKYLRIHQLRVIQHTNNQQAHNKLRFTCLLLPRSQIRKCILNQIGTTSLRMDLTGQRHHLHQRTSSQYSTLHHPFQRKMQFLITHSQKPPKRRKAKYFAAWAYMIPLMC